MIKILLITHFYSNHTGGIEFAAQRTAENITSSNKFLITWLAADIDIPPRNLERIICKPQKFYNFLEKLFPFTYQIPSIKAIKNLKEEVIKNHIVHIHEYFYIYNMLAYYYAKKYNKQIVITQHRGNIEWRNLFYRLMLKITNFLFGKRILKGADKVVCISSNVMEYFEKLGVKNIDLQANSVNIHHFIIYPDTKREFMRHQIGANNYKSTLLFVGKFSERKGVPFLIKLAKKFQKIQWIFVGYGSLKPEKYNLPNVLVYRDVENVDMPYYYNLADFLILPSYGEGLPLVIQEAFACGLRVITTTENAQAFPNLHHYVLHFPLNEKELWYEFIEKIEKKLYFPKIIRNELRLFASKYWSDEENGNYYIKLFEELRYGKFF